MTPTCRHCSRPQPEHCPYPSCGRCPKWGLAVDGREVQGCAVHAGMVVRRYRDTRWATS